MLLKSLSILFPNTQLLVTPQPFYKISLQGWKKRPPIVHINKMLKRDSSDMKAEVSQAFRALSLLYAREGHGWKGKQPLLNEPLKECPLYLGFITFIVNPSQPSSASHSFRASAAKCTIVYEPKSQGWKIPQLNDNYDYYEVIPPKCLFLKLLKWNVFCLHCLITFINQEAREWLWKATKKGGEYKSAADNYCGNLITVQLLIHRRLRDSILIRS